MAQLKEISYLQNDLWAIQVCDSCKTGFRKAKINNFLLWYVLFKIKVYITNKS